MSLISASNRRRFVTVVPMFVLAACAGSTSDSGTQGGQGGSTMGTAGAGAGGDTTGGGAMSNAACDVAEALRAAAILVPTFSGATASAVARLRPRRPIVALTHVDWAQRQMALEWGVTPVHIPEAPDVEELWDVSVSAAREAGLIAAGDRVVITAGTAVNIPGSTNVIKVDIA
jgi:pyruvate kinase